MTNDDQLELPLIMTAPDGPATDDRTAHRTLPTGPCDCLHCRTRAIIRANRVTDSKPGADDRQVA